MSGQIELTWHVLHAVAIDMWSVGCILAELIMGEVLFAGTSGIDQLVAIIKILGTPTREQVLSMNESYHEKVSFPGFEPVNLKRVRRRVVSAQAICSSRQAYQLLELLEYGTVRRLSPAPRPSSSRSSARSFATSPKSA